MRVLSDIVAFFIFFFAIAIYSQQEIISVKALDQTSFANAIEFSDIMGDAQLVGPDDDAEQITGLPLAESGPGIEDLYAFFPMNVFRAILHPAHFKPPELLRV